MLVYQKITSVLVDEVLIHPNGGLGVAELPHRQRQQCDSQHWSYCVALKKRHDMTKTMHILLLAMINIYILNTCPN